MPNSPRSRLARRFFTLYGLLFLVSGPLEIVMFFGLVPGFGTDIAERIPGPTAVKQVLAVLTPPMGAFLVAWGVWGIGDLEVTADGLRVPVSSPGELIRRTRRVIRFVDIEQLRLAVWRRRGEVLELDVRDSGGRLRTRRFETSWAEDRGRLLEDLRGRIEVRDTRGDRSAT